MNYIASVDGKLFCLNREEYQRFAEEFAAGTLDLGKYADKTIPYIEKSHFTYTQTQKTYHIVVNGMPFDVPARNFESFSEAECASMAAIAKAPQPLAETDGTGFSSDYELLGDMYDDEYFPDFLVDKVKAQLLKLDEFLMGGVKDIDPIQAKLDEIVNAINDLEEEFEEHDSEIETAARESIAEGVEYILKKHGIDIDIEEAIRERDW